MVDYESGRPADLRVMRILVIAMFLIGFILSGFLIHRRPTIRSESFAVMYAENRTRIRIGLLVADVRRRPRRSLVLGAAHPAPSRRG